MTGQDFITVIDHIFDNRNDFIGFALNGSIVRQLSYRFNLTPQEINIILNQMIADGQLVESGQWGHTTLYSPIREK